MKTIFASVILAIALPSLVRAQEEFPRNTQQAGNRVDRLLQPLPTQAERHVADLASWATVLTVVALDARATIGKCDGQDQCYRAIVTSALRVGITFGAALAIKKMVGRERPCHALYTFSGRTEEGVCGGDDAFSSFYSAHTALAFSTIGGPRLAVALPLAISTGGLRIAAGKHWLTDTLAGAGAGLLTSRIR